MKVAFVEDGVGFQVGRFYVRMWFNTTQRDTDELSAPLPIWKNIPAAWSDMTREAVAAFLACTPAVSTVEVQERFEDGSYASKIVYVDWPGVQP